MRTSDWNRKTIIVKVDQSRVFPSFVILIFVSELLKVQDEIITLRQVLGAKVKREAELKNLLGVGFVDDLKHDWNETMNDIKSSTAFQKTAETLHAATGKLAPTFQTVNTTLKSRLGSLRSLAFSLRVCLSLHRLCLSSFRFNVF